MSEKTLFLVVSINPDVFNGIPQISVYERIEDIAPMTCATSSVQQERVDVPKHEVKDINFDTQSNFRFNVDGTTYSINFGRFIIPVKLKP